MGGKFEPFSGKGAMCRVGENGLGNHPTENLAELGLCLDTHICVSLYGLVIWMFDFWLYLAGLAFRGVGHLVVLGRRNPCP